MTFSVVTFQLEKFFSCPQGRFILMVVELQPGFTQQGADATLVLQSCSRAGLNREKLRVAGLELQSGARLLQSQLEFAGTFVGLSRFEQFANLSKVFQGSRGFSLQL